FIFFTDTATTQISTLSLHDALPISSILTGPVANYPLADSHNLARERDDSTGDMPHVLVSSLVWDLPAGAGRRHALRGWRGALAKDRKSTRLNSSHVAISYAVFCLKK